MIRFSASFKFSRPALLAATALLLISTAQGAAARGGSHSGDHGGISHEFGREGSMMPHELQGHRDRGGDAGQYSRQRVRPDAGNKRTAKTRKDKTSGTVVAGAPPSPGTAGNNTIHPIVTNPAQPAANGSTLAGKLPPNDPVGNTHPTPGPNPPTLVTVSNGVTTTQIQNGPGGVAVYSDKPGTITITNGKETTTLSGGSVTLSGDVIGVGHGAGIEVGSRNGEGNTVVAITPSAPAPATAAPSHVTGGPEGGFFGDLGSSIKDGVKSVGHGIEDGTIAVGKGIADGLGIDPGFTAHPDPSRIVPPPTTSTIQQQ